MANDVRLHEPTPRPRPSRGDIVTIKVPHQDGVICRAGACCAHLREQVKRRYGNLGTVVPFESPWAPRPEPTGPTIQGYPVVQLDDSTAKATFERPAKMTKAEYRWGLVLEAQLVAGEILWYRFHGLTLLIGHDCRYTPDYSVVEKDGGLRFDEVKGAYIRRGDDGMVKLRTAASLFPFRFWLRHQQGHGWESTHIPKAA